MSLQQRFEDARHTLSGNQYLKGILEGDIGALADCFREWRKDCPDIEKTVSLTLPHLNLSQRYQSIIKQAAHCAAEPNDNAFHNNRHFLEVFAVSAMLGVRARQESRASEKDMALLLTAALIHDYKHDGKTNNGQQYRLESLAFESAQDALMIAGTTPEELGIVKAFILATDVSKNFADPTSVSPAESVKKYAATKNPYDLFKELSILADHNMADTALMLHDADLGTSLLSKDLMIQSSRNLSIENEKPYTPDVSAFFLDKICHKRLFSESGKKLIQPSMNLILQDFFRNDAAKPARKLQ